MKPIIYETSGGEIARDTFDVMLDGRDEYYPILRLALEYNQTVNPSRLAEARAKQIQTFLDGLNLSEVDPNRYFVVSPEEALYAEEKIRAAKDVEQAKADNLARRLTCARHLSEPLLRGMHLDPILGRAYKGAQFAKRPIAHCTKRMAMRGLAEATR